MASKIKPHKYWQSLENTIYEVKKVMEEHNYDTLPSGKKLAKLGYGSLNNAIRRYYSGFPNFREKHLGEELSRKPNGYYTLENTILEAKKVIKIHGFDTLPSKNKLEELGYHGLSHAITSHSGFLNFREIMNRKNELAERTFK